MKDITKEEVLEWLDRQLLVPDIGEYEGKEMWIFPSHGVSHFTNLHFNMKYGDVDRFKLWCHIFSKMYNTSIVQMALQVTPNAKDASPLKDLRVCIVPDIRGDYLEASEVLKLLPEGLSDILDDVFDGELSLVSDLVREDNLMELDEGEVILPAWVCSGEIIQKFGATPPPKLWCCTNLAVFEIDGHYCQCTGCGRILHSCDMNKNPLSHDIVRVKDGMKSSWCCKSCAIDDVDMYLKAIHRLPHPVFDSEIIMKPDVFGYQKAFGMKRSDFSSDNLESVMKSVVSIDDADPVFWISKDYTDVQIWTRNPDAVAKLRSVCEEAVGIHGDIFEDFSLGDDELEFLFFGEDDR